MKDALDYISMAPDAECDFEATPKPGKLAQIAIELSLVCAALSILAVAVVAMLETRF